MEESKVLEVLGLLKDRVTEQLADFPNKKTDLFDFYKVMLKEILMDLNLILDLDLQVYKVQVEYISRSILDKSAKLNYLSKLSDRRKLRLIIGDRLSYLAKIYRFNGMSGNEEGKIQCLDLFSKLKKEYGYRGVNVDSGEKKFLQSKLSFPSVRSCLQGLKNKKEIIWMYKLSCSPLHGNAVSLKIWKEIDPGLQLLPVVTGVRIGIVSIDKILKKRVYRTTKMYEKIDKVLLI